ncbi:MAG: hypothetical protein ACXQTS_05380 [Candidatus Methanospirareceae archaeon]
MKTLSEKERKTLEGKSAIAKFKRYKELRRIMGKEDRIVMDIEEMKRNLKVLIEGVRVWT